MESDKTGGEEKVEDRARDEEDAEDIDGDTGRTRSIESFKMKQFFHQNNQPFGRVQFLFCRNERGKLRRCVASRRLFFHVG